MMRIDKAFLEAVLKPGTKLCTRYSQDGRLLSVSSRREGSAVELTIDEASMSASLAQTRSRPYPTEDDLLDLPEDGQRQEAQEQQFMDTVRAWVREVEEHSLFFRRCSFCGKGQTEVKTLIAGPEQYICNECVAFCVDVLGD